ncbi:hypothetical protein SEA_KEITHERIE_61 [Mycobacterium phage Keitherie]|uniref:Uncharacterized protein n=1 Tax=Mycobacterium phage Keitherie TaxID=2488971 RepID=A0A3G8FPP3_9CAUD|nr:hypothetical protein SEA_KEITHERIE_61 [Mycobacterium phage Keitherie]
MTIKPCTCDVGGYCPMHGCPHKTGDRACRCADEMHTTRGQQPTEVPVDYVGINGLVRHHGHERPKPGTVGIGTPPQIAVKGAPERMAESEALRASLKGSPERPEIPPTGQLAEDIAREAIGLFNGPRQATYGDAADNFGGDRLDVVGDPGHRGDRRAGRALPRHAQDRTAARDTGPSRLVGRRGRVHRARGRGHDPAQGGWP